MKHSAGQAKRLLLRVIILAGLVWVIYANSLQGPFVFDDWHVIPQNPSVRGPANIPSFFTDISHFSILVSNRDYRPLFLTSMALCWWMGGGSTVPFHLVSVTLHMGSVILLFLILLRIFSKQSDLVGGLSGFRSEGAAFLAAVLFALHPLATESVNYISSQAVPLAVFFCLLSLYLFLLVHDGASPPTRRRYWLVSLGACTSYGLALLSKPIAISLPLILLLWEILLAGTSSEYRNTEKGLSQRIQKHLPYLAISGAYIVIRKIVFTQPFGGEGQIRPAFDHYLTETKAIVLYYLKLAFFPIGLNVDREYPISNSLLDGEVVFSILVILIIAASLYLLRKHRIVVFLGLWFPVALLLTTYGVILRQVVNEHRVYLSLAGFCALTAFAVFKLREAFPLKISDFVIGKRSGKSLTTVLVLLVVVLFGYSTRSRNAVWSSELTLWKDAVLNKGTWRAHMNYGLALEADGPNEEGLKQLKEAVRLGPFAFAHMNLGLAYLRRGEADLGLDHLRTAAQLYPTSPETHLYLGYGLREKGMIEEAEKELRQALALRPNYMKAYQYLGELSEARGRPDEALGHYRHLVSLDQSQSWVKNRIELLQKKKPEAGDSLFRRAIQSVRKQEFADAVALLDTCNQRQSGGPEILFNLGFAHQKLGNRETAILYYEQLLESFPDHRQGNFNLAYACLHGSSREKWSRSARLFQKVLQIDPGYSVSIHHLATACWKLGDEDRARQYDRLYLQQGVHADLKARSSQRLKGSPLPEDQQLVKAPKDRVDG